MNFGFPYFGGGKTRTNEYKNQTPPADVTFPQVEMDAHAADLGMTFYNGRMFPQNYRGGIFSAQHGSWNRTTPVGARVMFTPLKEDGTADKTEVFADGWLTENGEYLGRPVDVAQLPDGSLLVSDDFAGAHLSHLVRRPLKASLRAAPVSGAARSRGGTTHGTRPTRRAAASPLQSCCWQPPRRQLPAMSPPAAARRLACQACHGLDGLSKLPDAPHLAGQPERYLVKSLDEYRKGVRKNELMSSWSRISATRISPISRPTTARSRFPRSRRSESEGGVSCAKWGPVGATVFGNLRD